MPRRQLVRDAFRPRGETYVYHVFTPALVYRLDPKNNNPDLPTIALRNSKDNYTSFWLVRGIVSFGQVDLTEKFKLPLSGTSGRGVVYCVTSDPFTVSYYPKQTAVIKTTDDKGLDRDPKDILADVLREYL